MGNKSPRFFRGTTGMGFVYDAIFANADFWSCEVQMYKSYNNLHRPIFLFVAFEPFCFPSV